jgi:DNA-binding NtrC family response regulator
MKDRHNVFRRNIPNEFKIVHSFTAKDAIAALDTDTYDLVLLDHDLGTRLDGEDVSNHICESNRKHKTIIVHTMNSVAGPRMADSLTNAGYKSGYIPFSQLIKDLKRVLPKGEQI